MEDLGFVRKMTYSQYIKLFKRQSNDANLYELLGKYDILLPGRTSFAAYSKSNRDGYIGAGHPEILLNDFCRTAHKLFPKYDSEMEKFSCCVSKLVKEFSCNDIEDDTACRLTMEVCVVYKD